MRANAFRPAAGCRPSSAPTRTANARSNGPSRVPVQSPRPSPPPDAHAAVRDHLRRPRRGLRYRCRRPVDQRMWPVVSRSATARAAAPGPQPISSTRISGRSGSASTAAADRPERHAASPGSGAVVPPDALGELDREAVRVAQLHLPLEAAVPGRGVHGDPAFDEVGVQRVEIVGAHLDLHERAAPIRRSVAELQEPHRARPVAEQPEPLGADLECEPERLVERDRPVELGDRQRETLEPDVHDTPRASGRPHPPRHRGDRLAPGVPTPHRTGSPSPTPSGSTTAASSGTPDARSRARARARAAIRGSRGRPTAPPWQGRVRYCRWPGRARAAGSSCRSCRTRRSAAPRRPPTHARPAAILPGGARARRTRRCRDPR